MEAIDKELLNEIIDAHEYEGAYNIRKNGQGIAKNVTENVNYKSSEFNLEISKGKQELSGEKALNYLMISI